MAWLYSRSSTWRKIVNATQRSSIYLVGFTAAAVGIPYYLGDFIQSSTNNSKQQERLEEDLRHRKGSVDAQMLAKAQKERLQVLFDELKKGGDEARYKAALNGESLGTHSKGTTVNAVAINPNKRS